MDFDDFTRILGNLGVEGDHPPKMRAGLVRANGKSSDLRARLRRRRTHARAPVASAPAGGESGSPEVRGLLRMV